METHKCKNYEKKSTWTPKKVKKMHCPIVFLFDDNAMYIFLLKTLLTILELSSTALVPFHFLFLFVLPNHLHTLFSTFFNKFVDYTVIFNSCNVVQSNGCQRLTINTCI